jgi:hypothetical protein
MSLMKLVTTIGQRRHTDTLALLGIVTGIGMLFPVFFLPDLAFLAVPGFLVLAPSILVGAQ